MVHGGDWTGAEAAFGCALEIDENFHDARYNLAKLLKEKGDFEKAVFAYRTLLEKQPSHEDSLYNLANLHCELDQLSEATALYSQVLKQNPEHINALVNLSLIKERQGQKRQAVKLLERAVELDPNHRHAYRALRRQYSKSVAAWHFDMLNDHERNQAYLSAISSAVTEKTHVLEIGTGSGLLSMMAARAGARKVTTCEMVAPLARVAGKIIAKNGYADRIKVIPKKSTSLRLGEDVDELADILIAEVFDNGLLGEHFLPSLLHARQTLLTKEAVVIPMGATVSGMLVSCPEMRNVNPMGSICGFDLGAFDVFRREGYKQIDLQTLDHQALSQPVSLCRLNFQTGVLRENRKIVPFPIEKTGTCHALVFLVRSASGSEPYDFNLEPCTVKPLETGNSFF